MPPSEQTFWKWDTLPSQAYTATVAAQTVNGERGQLCRFVMAPGTRTPAAAPVRHEAEQLSVLLSGRLDLRLGERQAVVGPGAVWFIPSGVEHFSTILEAPSELFDFHVPHRQEFTPSGREPDPGPPPTSDPVFSRWEERAAERAGAATVQRLVGERSELKRVLVHEAPADLPPIETTVEHFFVLLDGALRVRLGAAEHSPEPGSVWIVPEGADYKATVAEAPVELIHFRARLPTA